MQTPFVQSSPATFGVLYALIAAVLAAFLVLLRRQLHTDPFWALWAAAIVALLRAIFFMVDPYHYHSIPLQLASARYWLHLRVCLPVEKSHDLCLVLFGLHSLVTRTKLSQEGFAWQPPGWVRPAIFLTCLVQMLVQLLSDVLRAAGYAWYWLSICRMFFVAWGVAIALGLTVWAAQLWNILQARLP
jgi:hypothetical protein